MIEEVDHAKAAAAGDVAEEATVTSALWAAGVDVPDPGLYLLTVSRHSKELDDAILASPRA